MSPQSQATSTRTTESLRGISPEATQELLQLLVDNIKEYAILTPDPKGFVITWTPGAERIKGYTRDEILGQHFSIFYTKEDVDAGKCERELEAAARDGRFEDEGWRVRKDGTRFWASVVLTALRDGNGNFKGFGKGRQSAHRRHRGAPRRVRHEGREGVRESRAERQARRGAVAAYFLGSGFMASNLISLRNSG